MALNLAIIADANIPGCCASNASNFSMRIRPALCRQTHARHVAFADVDIETTVRLLSQCRGIIRLGLFRDCASPALLPSIIAMPLERLAFTPEDVFGSSNIDFGHALFAHLTHLDIVSLSSSDAWPSLGQIPRLTHLSVNWLAERVFVQSTFAHCKRLEVLALLCSDLYQLEDFLDECHHFADDPRSVLMTVDDYLHDWKVGAHGVEDYWVHGAFYC
ncbi:hypothetical protein DFH09DRAFT_1368173 [Mycena vulgaris]|nr:hypothetical protein DFH09DRAFT_1368173 [Mycena vulgaris]